MNSELYTQSIQAYLDLNGIAYNSAHGYLKLSDHDSCVVETKITPSHPYETFYWNSRGVGGNLSNFLTEYMGMEKKKMYSVLNEMAGKHIVNVHKPEVVKPFDPTAHNGVSGHTKVTNYLVNQRHLSKNTISALFKSDCLRQTKDGNALFGWHDNQRRMTGGDIQGTQIDHKRYGKRGTLKKILPSSETKSGFSFKTGGGKDVLAVFESPIDALSYYEMNRQRHDNRSVTYLSLNGAATKLKTIDNYIQTRCLEPKEIHLCFDTDRAGKTADLKFIKEHGLDTKNQVTINNQTAILKISRPQSGNKDWNEGLQNGQKRIITQTGSDFVKNFATTNRDQFMDIMNELSPVRKRKIAPSVKQPPSLQKRYVKQR